MPGWLGRLLTVGDAVALAVAGSQANGPRITSRPQGRTPRGRRAHGSRPTCFTSTGLAEVVTAAHALDLEANCPNAALKIHSKSSTAAFAAFAHYLLATAPQFGERLGLGRIGPHTRKEAGGLSDGGHLDER